MSASDRLNKGVRGLSHRRGKLDAEELVQSGGPATPPVFTGNPEKNLITSAQPWRYASQLAQKERRLNNMLSELGAPAAEVHASPSHSYRMRVEFRMWHDGDELYYAMFDPVAAKTPVRVDTFDIAAGRIQQAMPLLLEKLKSSQELRNKLFQVEFLASLSGQLLITLIYHRQLTELWDKPARVVGEQLDARFIGRSRGQKRVLTVDHVDEVLNVEGSEYQYRQQEQVFTQPNARVNVKMLAWACQQAAPLGGDLLELYCGNGNFSIPLSRHFQRVLATEVSQSALNAARHNAAANGTDNLDLVRLSAREVIEALACKRQFRRLQDIGPLSQYDFSTIFVDPPRSGLDRETEQLVSRFDNILYISCNPHTLLGNLHNITHTHAIKRLALFDQFPYTPHIECGVYLGRH
ncbi:MAG: tRNA (uridine(54)-C5)-methyltransferase TrmA [Halieaceae bacterium]|nr:tRNA (uridine(54)-C5)-methyltransferase TrmA [Halieaceae bacterium]